MKIQTILKTLFYSKCEVCDGHKPNTYHFRFYEYNGQLVETICEDCIEQDLEAGPND